MGGFPVWGSLLIADFSRVDMKSADKRSSTMTSGNSAASILFETGRLLFRNFHHSDRDSVHRYASDLVVTRMTYWGPYTLRDTDVFIQRAIRNAEATPRSFFDLAIVPREGDPEKFRLIGGCKIHITDHANREGEIGYYLERESWKKGLATESARALLSFGFTCLGLHRMTGLCFTENRGSARVLEKIGMTREGVLRKHRMKEGQWVDSFLYSILDSEWQALREKGTGVIPE